MKISSIFLNLFVPFFTLASFCNSHFAFALFENVPPAHTVGESKLLYRARSLAVLKYFADQDLGLYERSNGLSFPVKAIAKLKLNQDVALVNERLLDPKVKPYALTGTDFTDLGQLCRREGDYDFSLRGLVQLAYEFWNQPEKLWPQTREKLMNVFFVETGNEVALSRWFGRCLKLKETENHILLTEGSRLLTNQLWIRQLREQGKLTSELESKYDNDKNGMNVFMVKHLSQFLKHDFEEFNSRPYQKFTWGAIQNIFEYAENPEVKNMAKMVLDYLGGKFASSSKDLRRFAPFCRQPEHRKDDDFLGTDSLGVIYSILAGNFQFASELKDPWSLNHWTLLGLAVGNYRAPDLILDLILNHGEKNRTYFQRFDHLGKEIYAGSPSFLISSGGRFVNQFDMGSGKIDAWGLATTLIPRQSGMYLNDVFHFKGSKLKGRVNNTCVTQNFACGLRPFVPENIPVNCFEKHGNWTFYNFNSSECSRKDGFYLVHFQGGTHQNPFGFLEAREPTISFEEFKERVLRGNETAQFKRHGWNSYRTSDARTIQFKFSPALLSEEAIRFQGTSELAEGDFMSADGTGLVILKNPYTHQELVLDGRP